MFRLILIGGLAAAVMASAGAADAARHGLHAAKNERAPIARTHHLRRRFRDEREAFAAAGFGRDIAYRGDALDFHGGPRLVTSRPVPDTPRNRARFGGPMSNGGRMTPAVGD